MPFARIISGAVNGIEASEVSVEVNIDYKGFPNFSIVGLASKEIEESKDRIRSAIKYSGLKFPSAKITVNLAPADTIKRGSLYDLPIAIGILRAANILNRDIDDYFLFGELSLDGRINKILGAIPLFELAEKSEKQVIAPIENLNDSKYFKRLKILSCKTLSELISQLNSVPKIVTTQKATNLMNPYKPNLKLFNQIEGNIIAKRAVLIAVAGRHSIAFAGPPGVGKSMLSQSIPAMGIPLSEKEKYEITKIQTAFHPNIDYEKEVRPFRSPHYTIGRAGLMGGGTPVRPGEFTLAHKGVLYLDELPLFKSECIDALREPLEKKRVCVNRSGRSITYPADFQLVSSYNLCPCGYLGHKTKDCICTPSQIRKYMRKISGPILDRIDMHVFVSETENIKARSDRENSAEIINKLSKSIELQTARYKEYKQNSAASNIEIQTLFSISDDAKGLINKLRNDSILSSRSFYKILKVARTIADLEGSSVLTDSHVSEAFQYRQIKFA